jgi:hypothetical protein
MTRREAGGWRGAQATAGRKRHEHEEEEEAEVEGKGKAGEAKRPARAAIAAASAGRGLIDLGCFRFPLAAFPYPLFSLHSSESECRGARACRVSFFWVLGLNSEVQEVASTSFSYCTPTLYLQQYNSSIS